MDDSLMYKNVLVVRNAKEAEFFNIPGVFAVGIGLNSDEGTEGNMRYAIHVFIDKNIEGAVEVCGAVTGEVDGVPVKGFLDAPYVPESDVDTDVDRGEYRPLRGGIQVSERGASGVGTMGCLVKDSTGKIYGLSNAHVLRNTGKNVDQPNKNDCDECCDSCNNRVGKVSKSIISELVDAAIFEIRSGMGWRNEIVDIAGNVQGLLDINETHLGQNVIKRGRTTRLTRGTISVINMTVNVRDLGIFRDQIRINPVEGTPRFSNRGDSGSVVLLESGNLVIGLHFAGNGFSGASNRISHVISAMGIDIITGTQAGGDQTSNDPDFNMGDALNKIKTRIDASDDEDTKRFVRLLYKHANEVLYLVNHNKAVTLAWHRNKGPERFRQYLQGGQPEGFTFEVGILEVMGEMLYIKGSPELRVDILRYKDFLIEQFKKLWNFV